MLKLIVLFDVLHMYIIFLGDLCAFDDVELGWLNDLCIS